MCTVTRLEWKPPGQLDHAFSPLPVCDHACDDSQSRHSSVKARSRSPSPAHTGDRFHFLFLVLDANSFFKLDGSLLLAAERVLLAHAGFPRPGVCSGQYPVLSGFRQRQLVVPRRAPTYFSHFTRLQIFEPPPGVALYPLLSFCVLLCVAPKLRSLHITHPVSVASRYYQSNPPFSLAQRGWSWG